MNRENQENVLDANRRVWEERARRGEVYATPATSREFEDPLAVVDQCNWLGNVRGRRLLCLAAGGGRHSALFAAAGAVVTVVDISPRLLELDREVARARSLSVTTIETSMEDLSMLGEAGFEIVVQPVSSCYVPDVRRVYQQVARVTVPDGIYVSQHKQPAALQAGAVPSGNGYLMNQPYDGKAPLPKVGSNFLHREAGAVEFLHRWEDLIGGLCQAGFVIEDLAEPRHADPKAEPGTAGHRACYLPPFVKIKARRIGGRKGGLLTGS